MTNSFVMPVERLVKKLNAIKCAMGDAIKIYKEGASIFAETFNQEIHARIVLEKEHNYPFKTWTISSQLCNIVSKMPTGKPISLYFDDDQLIMKCNNNTTHLAYFTDSYPSFDDFAKDFSSGWVIKDLGKILKKTSLSSAKDGLLAGINFINVDSEIMIRTCDRFRVSQFVCDSEKYQSFPEEINITIPAANLMKVFDQFQGEENVYTYTESNKVVLSNDPKSNNHVTYVLRLIDGIYPKVETFIPDKSKYVIEIKSDDILSALDRCNVFSEPGNEVVELQFGKSVLVLFKKTNIGQAEEKIYFEGIDGPEKVISIALSISFLKAAIKSYDCKKFNFCFTDATKPILILPAKESKEKTIDDSIIQLILPVRVN